MSQPAESPDRAVGERIRRARMSRGISQTDLARTVSVSPSYLSLIEAGRRPISETLLQAISDRLDVSRGHLLTGEPHASSGGSEDNLDLKFAEMALRNGDSTVARQRYEEILVSPVRDAEGRDRALEARLGLAMVLETQGDLVGALEALELSLADLAHGEAGGDGSRLRLRLHIAMCRIYRESGDLARAIELGEAATAGLPADLSRDPDALELEIQVVSTLAGCYFERGDLTKAHLLTKSALARADAPEGLPLARAAAYWNASVVAEARGDLANAHRYVDRARAIYSESDNQRALALLKLVSGWLILQDSDPLVDDAEQLIRSALTQLPLVGTEVDIAYGEVELARCRMLAGAPEEAAELAQSAIGRLSGGAQLQGARARLTLGQARLLLGDQDDALEVFATAAQELQALGGKRQAATAWRELAEVLSALGRTDAALDAYRRATDAAGIALPATHVAPLLEAAQRRP